MRACFEYWTDEIRCYKTCWLDIHLRPTTMH